MNAQVQTRAEEWALRPTDPPVPRSPLGEIAAAFAKAQLEMHNPKFDAANPFFKSRYASLAAVRNAVIPCFAKHGICTAQDLITSEGTIACTTILTHSSGQQMVFGPLVLPVSKEDAQGYTAAGTYAKRIALQSVAAVVGDDDDDGNAAAGKTDQSPKGDAVKSIPIDEARKHALAMLAIIQAPAKDGDHDEVQKGLDALDYQRKHFQGNNELYIASAEQMEVAKRNVWKALINKAKTAESMDKAVSNTGKRW